jgi:hypothetical protein
MPHSQKTPWNSEPASTRSLESTIEGTAITVSVVPEETYALSDIRSSEVALTEIKTRPALSRPPDYAFCIQIVPT